MFAFTFAFMFVFVFTFVLIFVFVFTFVLIFVFVCVSFWLIVILRFERDQVSTFIVENTMPFPLSQ